MSEAARQQGTEVSLSDSDIASLREEADSVLSAAQALDALESARIAFLGKNGSISARMKLLGKLPPEEKKHFGAELNLLRNYVTQLIDEKKAALEKSALDIKLQQEQVDVTLPPRPQQEGSIHPVSQVMDEITSILGEMGFTFAEGPEIEDDFHNFGALNIPESHPARQMHDTFYLPEDAEGNTRLLRTHTSSVQIRAMEKGKPPFRIMALGRVYRCDSDATHTPMFHQVEGLYIDKGIHMGHLKGCLIQFIRAFFGIENLRTRLRPSYFPFTEPSAEMDIGCHRSKDELVLGEGEDWLEVLGCGMVHPNVLRNVGLDPNEYQGFAFGMGIDRLAMLKYGIPDLRPFFESDARWLEHYQFRALDIPTLVGRLVK